MNQHLSMKTIQQSGYQQKLKYKPVNRKINNKRSLKRNTISFNAPFSKNVATKFDKYFLNLLETHLRKLRRCCGFGHIY